MDLKYTHKLEQCAGYVHFRSSAEAAEAVLFLHGNSEAANYPGEKQQGPIRLLRHPLPAYFCAPGELANVVGWRQGDPVWGFPSEEVHKRWQQRYELFAPQKRQAGPWTVDELTEVRDKILSQRSHWHLSGTSYGGAGALQLIQLCGRKPFASLGLACPKPYNSVPADIPPAWARYGTQDLADVIEFCVEHKQRLAAEPLDGKDHAFVCRHAYTEGKFFEWLQALGNATSRNEAPRPNQSHANGAA